MVSCPRVWVHVHGTIHMPRKNSRPDKVMEVVNGLWTCGRSCGVRTNLLQVRWCFPMWCLSEYPPHYVACPHDLQGRIAMKAQKSSALRTERRAAATVCSLWCTSFITVIKARGGEHCVFMKLSCLCSDPSLFGLPCYLLYTSRSDCKSIIRSCRFRICVDGSSDQDISAADRRQLSWILKIQRGVWICQSVSAWFQNRGV